MAETSDIYHDGRVLKEAYSLTENNYNVKVYGFRNDWVVGEKLNFQLRTFYIFPRKFRILRNISIAINIAVINLLILLTRAQFYHAHNTMFLISMYISSRLYGGRFIYDCHEVQWELNKIASTLERIFIKKPDKIINVSDGRAKYQAQKYNIPLSKITVISNYPKLPENRTINMNFIEQTKISFIFSGDYDLKSNPLDNLLISLKEFPFIEFSLLSKDDGKNSLVLREKICELDLQNRVKFLPLVAPDELIEFLSKFDCAVNFLINPKNLISRNYHGLNKIYEYLAAGLPILCSNLPSFQEELQEEGVGICVNPLDISAIKKGIQLLISDPNKVREMKKKAINLSNSKYNWNTQYPKLIGLYKNMRF